jgi:hypothetical protein
MKFTYSSGQRPLDGYTLKRGIGKGGFGEVYFAVSDGGKEVALKLVRGNLDVELRGVAQCLNLKHTNLVSLYDLRTDAQGDRWVVMEYIAGEPLNVVLGRHPSGLPVELAVQWFLALAKAVGCLHDHGIVHRDLKPGNIFLENGTVKVGDYGLCKFMSSSQRTAQTQSVGTVHYMAPEISTGNYNKQIDIYAAGIILYEMLSGRVPFEGESAGEILMKHLTTPPDLSKLPPEFVPIVGKALAKNPAHRYGSMAEMAKAVESATEEREVRSEARAARSPEPAPAYRAAPRPAAVAHEPILTVLPAVTFRGQAAELSGSLALTALFAAIGTTLLAAVSRNTNLNDLLTGFYLTVAVSWAILLPAKFWSGQRGDSWMRRMVMLVFGVGVGVAAMWLDGWLPRLPAGEAYSEAAKFTPQSFRDDGVTAVASCLSYFGVAFFALRWWKMADRRRSHRFSFAPILAAGFWAYALLWVLCTYGPWREGVGARWAVALVMSSAIVQLVSPWEPPPPPSAKRMKLRYA